ncbi:chemotaxis protein CheB [Roseomonas indoligenes]|uniref:protein-glutamate methylesterase n=1 Tax=Roseomonas indoligenes TaxID=2820811 RepID=A0A940MXP9_9PROT|nr:chemotaxis protein CheB [Pararoseomonas indoligenes]MBP0493598.1 chemotaxis protein CheB [Pararoseomonas indoligenes]
MTQPSNLWFVAMGASGAEGLDDLKEVLREFPANFRAVVLIVLHRPWGLPTHLRSILSRASSLPVLVAEEGELFETGHVYIGEPEEHLTLAARSFGAVTPDPARLHRNRTVDLLFRSVAEFAAGRAIGVVLSGSLDDGSRGLAAIHAAGGLTMVLTPRLFPRHGMPENAIGYDGPVDVIGSPARIAAAIRAAIGTGGRDPAGLRRGRAPDHPAREEPVGSGFP